MDTEGTKAATLPSDRFPSEAELAEGRKHSTLTRDEMLRALDRCTWLCAILIAANKELQEAKQQREHAAGGPQKSNGKGGV